MIFKTRPYKDEDLNFVLDTWLKPMENHDPMAKRMHMGIYKKNLRTQVEAIMKLSTITVAHNPEDESHIYGYVVHRTLCTIPIISWVHVKKPFRNLRMASALLEPIIKNRVSICTYKLDYLGRVMAKYEIIHNPYPDLRMGVSNESNLC